MSSTVTLSDLIRPSDSSTYSSTLNSWPLLTYSTNTDPPWHYLTRAARVNLSEWHWHNLVFATMNDLILPSDRFDILHWPKLTLANRVTLYDPSGAWPLRHNTPIEYYYSHRCRRKSILINLKEDLTSSPVCLDVSHSLSTRDNAIEKACGDQKISFNKVDIPVSVPKQASWSDIESLVK